MAKRTRDWAFRILSWTKNIRGKSNQQKIKSAIKWLAAEHHYLKRISKDLADLQADVIKARAVQESEDIARALRDFRYVGRCERRFQDSGQEVEEIFDALKRNLEGSGTLQELELLARHIRIATETVIKNCSLREGLIKNKLLIIQSAISSSVPFPPKGATGIPRIRDHLREAEQLIAETQEWIAALSKDLDKAMELDRGLTARALLLERDAQRATGRLRV